MSDTLLPLLERLVAIPSVTGQEQDLADFCADYLQAQGFRVHTQDVLPGRYNLLAERGEPSSPDASGQRPTLLLAAHLDTVAPDSNWSHDPYQVQRCGDRLTGLGCSDMKGGLALILDAVRDFEPRHFRLKLALTVDEEAYSAGAWTLLNSGFIDDCDAVVVPELSVDAEEITLGVGRRGHFSAHLETWGQRQHAALEQSGDSAIDVALDLLQSLRHQPQRHHPQWGQEQVLTRRIQAQSAFGFSTPESCQVELACLSLPGLKQAEWLKHLEAFWQKQHPEHQGRFRLTAQARPTPAAEAYLSDLQSDFYLYLQAQAQDFWGRPLPLSFGVSVADENIYARSGRPVLSLAPVGGKSHRAGEWLSLQSICELRRFYRQFLEQYKTRKNVSSP